MDRLKKPMVAFLFLALFLALAAIFPSFFLSNVIQPIALVFWAILRILNSVNQSVYWMVLIVVCMILVIRLIPTEPGAALKGAYQYRYRADNRIAYWQTLISETAFGEEDGKDLRDNLQKLLLAALPQHERSQRKPLEEIVSSRKATLSPEAQRFLFPPKESDTTSASGHWFRKILLRPRWARAWTGRFVYGHTALIAEILTWIETEMEIHYDQ